MQVYSGKSHPRVYPATGRKLTYFPYVCHFLITSLKCGHIQWGALGPFCLLSWLLIARQSFWGVQPYTGLLASDS